MTTSQRPWTISPHNHKQILDAQGVLVATFQDAQDVDLCLERVNGVGERIEKICRTINEVADELEDLCSERA